MQLHPDVWRQLFKPRWLMIIFLSVLLAAGGGLWLGLQQDQGESSTTFVFGSRVGFDAPLIDLEDHISDIVNSVEFPTVFERIEQRVELEAGEDYDLEIGILENTQSVVSIEIETRERGQASRISTIVAEEMVRFVLEGVGETVATDLEQARRDVADLNTEQERLIDLAGGITPPQAEASINRQLAAVRSDTNEPVGTLEGRMLQVLSDVTPLADQFRENQLLIDGLEAEVNAIVIQQADIDAASRSISSLWYRSISPAEATSNLPVAIAMAFAAAVPALVLATLLVVLNINRRLVYMARAERKANEAHLAAA